MSSGAIGYNKQRIWDTAYATAFVQALFIGLRPDEARLIAIGCANDAIDFCVADDEPVRRRPKKG